MRYQDMPGFMRQLKDETNAVFAQSALELLILTATRTNEVVQAQWTEFDWKAALWTIPAARMKAGREHRAPLSKNALAILEQLFAGTDWTQGRWRHPLKQLEGVHSNSKPITAFGPSTRVLLAPLDRLLPGGKDD
ncbi:MAG: tyrosine-type recombinase/integrase [Pseudomonadota bacterium]